MKRSLALAALAVAGAATAYCSSIESVDAGGSRLADRALAYLGVPYRLAGVDESGMDCSGLVWTVYREAARLDLPRTVAGLIGQGRPVEGPPRPGDLLFFDTTGGPSHVGIALDERRFVHAASEGPQTGVIVSSIDEPYYSARLIEARRVAAPGPGRLIMTVDEEPVRASLAGPVAAGSPLEFTVASASGGGERMFVTLRAMLDGQEMLARRLRVLPDGGASVWLIPGPGRWVVSVDAGQGLLAELSFVAGGLP